MAKPEEENEESVDTSHVGESLQMESGLEAFFENHLVKILLAGIVIIIGAGAWVFMKESGKVKDEKAAVAFTSAFTREDLQMVTTDHPGTTAAGNAALMIAERDLTTGKTEAAGRQFEDFLSNFPKHPRRSQAEFGLGVVAEKEGNMKKAEGHFRAVMESESEIGPLAMIHLANIQAAGGDPETALKTLDAIMKRYVGNPFIDFVEQRSTAIRREMAKAENPPPPFEWPVVEEPAKEDDGETALPTIPIDPASLPEGTTSTPAIEIPSLSDLGSEGNPAPEPEMKEEKPEPPEPTEEGETKPVPPPVTEAGEGAEAPSETGSKPESDPSGGEDSAEPPAPTTESADEGTANP